MKGQLLKTSGGYNMQTSMVEEANAFRTHVFADMKLVDEDMLGSIMLVIANLTHSC